MKRRAALAAAVLACGGALQGCAQYYYGDRASVAPVDLVKAGYAQHLLTVAASDHTVRLLPPLTITDEEIAEAVARLDRAAAKLEV